MMLVLASCGLETGTSNCADGARCPTDKVCVPSGGCALPDQISACATLDEGARCTIAGAPGVCLGGVCTSGCGDAFVNVDQGEECEATDFRGLTCESLGFHGGDLSCDACVIDASGCAGVCGDQTVNGGEICDGEAGVPPTSCSSQGWGRGFLSCTEDCSSFMEGCRALGLTPVPNVSVQGEVVGIAGLADALFVATSGGQVLHSDGRSWATDVALGALVDLYQAADGALFAMGAHDVYYRRGPRDWEVIYTTDQEPLRSLWSGSAESVVAIDDGGATHVFGGGTWTVLPAVAGRSFFDVDGLGSVAYTIGAEGTQRRLYRLDGSEWLVAAAAPNSLTTIEAGVDSLYLGGTNAFARYKDGEFDDLGFSQLRYKAGVKRAREHEGIVYVISASGIVSRFDGADWWQNNNSLSNTRFIQPVGPWRVYIGGNALFRMEWTRVCTQISCPGNELVALAGRSDTEWWLLTLGGELYQRQGAGFSLVTDLGAIGRHLQANSQELVAAVDSTLHSLEGAAWSDVTLPWAPLSLWLGEDGTAAVGGPGGEYGLRVEGQWSFGTIADGFDLPSVSGIDADYIWFLDAAGVIHRRAQDGWTAITPPGTYHDLYAVAPDEVLLGGLDRVARLVGTRTDVLEIGFAGIGPLIAGSPARFFVQDGSGIVTVTRRVPWNGCSAAEVCGNRLDDDCDGYVDNGC
jgi:hypothetical protein